MRAVVVDRWMPHSELRVSEVPEPPLGPGEVRVETRAAGCNFFDTLICRGKYQVRPDLPFSPGAEVAGVVCELGEGVEGLALGDRVFASKGYGCFAERVAFPAASVYRMPEGMSFEEAAAIPMIYPTSYAALVFRAALRSGETLLVHAAAGGVGLAAVQIGKALGATVIGTAGGAEKLAVAREAGADFAIDYRREDFVARVEEITEGRGADVIYDSVGGDTFDRSLKCIAWNGRLIVVGFASGEIPSVRANRILLKNIAITGIHWGAYAEKEPERIPETFHALLELYERGGIRPVIYGRYPVERVAEALEALASRKTHGKVVLTF